jgi:hypothetical protein
MAIVKPNDFAPATVAESAKVDQNFDIPYNLLNGTSTDQDTILRLNHGSLPTLRLDQLGAGPILLGRQNITETFKVLVDGKIFHAAIIDVNGNEVIVPIGVASAVNEIAVTNAAAAGRPKIAAQGGDTNIDLELAGKGTGLIRLPSADPTNNDHAVRKLYTDTRRYRWSGNFYISDPQTRGVDANFEEIQGLWVPGANFVATHVGAKFTHGSASGSFTIEFRKQPFGSGSQTNLGSVTFNTGTINVGIETDIGDHAFTANDWVYAVITAASSPLQRSVWCAVRGYQTPENP